MEDRPNKTTLSVSGFRLKSISPLVSPELWILIASGILMGWVSWLKWPDVIIDFGEQAYIAWRLSEGDILYRDIVYFYGPLSSTIHALLFKLFGPQLIVLIYFNLLLVAVLTLMIYRLFLRVGSRLSATMAGLTFLMVFAFAQYLWIGNYNFVCPYVYDVTHGIFLSFLAAGQFVKFSQTRNPWNLMLLGLFSGLVLLTKIEVSLAWMTAVHAGLFLRIKTWNLKLREAWNIMALFLPALLLPFAVFTVYFGAHMGWSQGLEAMLGPWTYVFSTSVRSLAFYQSVMGTGSLGENLVLILKYLFSLALFLAVLGALNHALRKPFAQSPLFAILAIVLVLVGLQTFQSLVPWLQLLRPLPFIMLGASVVLAFRLWKGNYDSSDPVPTLVMATLTIFATILLLKIFFNTHVFHYGTALAMPATLIFFKFLIDDLPAQLKTRSGDYLFFKGAIVAGLSFFAFTHFSVTADWYAKKNFPVAADGDRLFSYNPKVVPHGLFFRITLDILKEEMKEGETLATFPTGTLLNYLVRKNNPTDSISFNPGTQELLGEHNVLRKLKATPPTYIAIVYHDFLEFDYRFFGKDFGTDIYQWILEDYSSFKLIGRDPLAGEGFGIHLFKLKPLTRPNGRP